MPPTASLSARPSSAWRDAAPAVRAAPIPVRPARLPPLPVAARTAALATPGWRLWARATRDPLLLGGVVAALHAMVALAVLTRSQPAPVAAPQPQMIELVTPVVVPPQAVEPPPPPKRLVEPPKPRAAIPPPAPAPALRTPPAAAAPQPEAVTVAENLQASKTSAPVEAAPAAPPAPLPPKEEPVVEASADAAYLRNPPPRYPEVAQRQGWQGTVVLRVRVLAGGQAESVEVRQSSGRKVLDEAAVAAVKGWTFVPSRRGATPIDGWATVPIEFKLAR